MQTLTATYSPEDNKLRLYSTSRLDADLYQRIRSAGFIHAPKQDLYVAPMWTPERADLLTELCSEIGDEDTSLVERAEQRADRFEDYSDSRRVDAENAHDAATEIMGHIPPGQPILVGHHSERRARKEAQRIDDAMRRAVNMWDTADYWKRRAAGALRHAKYKQRREVRARRIKGIEADLRKAEKTLAQQAKLLKLWATEKITHEQALMLADYTSVYQCYPLTEYPRAPEVSQAEGQLSLYSALHAGIVTIEQARDIGMASCNEQIAVYSRWADHYKNRIAYERAMLDEQGGIITDKYNLEVGGKALIGNSWMVIMRVNKKDGKAVSISSNNGRYRCVRNVEDIIEYQPPTAEVVAAVESVKKLPPLTNYPGEGFIEITKEEWQKIPSENRRHKVIDRNSQYDKHRARAVFGVYLEHRVNLGNQRYNFHYVYVVDDKRKDPPPAPVADISDPDKAQAQAQREFLLPEKVIAVPAVPKAEPEKPADAVAEDINGMRNTLQHGGAQIVVAHQLFPTPPDIAAQMIELADVKPGLRYLEPHAGTARIVRALFDRIAADDVDLVAVEINRRLCDSLRASFPTVDVCEKDFLECDDLGSFDRIILNPPFENAIDIVHIVHALSMLNDGGRLVAVCAAGHRQTAELKTLAERRDGLWMPLPEGAFKSSGTMVNTALLVIDN